MYLALSTVCALTLTKSGWLEYVSFFHWPNRRYLREYEQKSIRVSRTLICHIINWKLKNMFFH